MKPSFSPSLTGLALCALLIFSAGRLQAQETPPAEAPATEGGGAGRGSLVEDRAARQLLQAGEQRLAADEASKALEIWQSIIERYPRSRVRFEAHMRLGHYLLERERAYDRARNHFEAAAAEANSDEDVRAEATLKMGICFYEVRNYGKSFKVMRDVIEQFPVSAHVNQAYYYIGLGHFQLGHYSRAIDALEKVGTALSNEEGKIEKVEAGKRLFIKVEDADLAALEPGVAVPIRCTSGQGDQEDVPCFAVGRNVRIVLGSVMTSLGKPQPGNGILEVRGDDRVQIAYVDRHTADKMTDRPVQQEILVVGNGVIEITDGAFKESLRGVVLDRGVNLQITDPDRDLTDAAESLTATVEVLRLKTQQELDSEALDAAAKAAVTETPAAPVTDGEKPAEPEIDLYKVIDRLEVPLVEVVLPRAQITEIPGAATEPAPAAPGNPAGGAEAPAENAPPPALVVTTPADDGTVHSGVFRLVVPLIRNEQAVADDDQLQAVTGDLVQVTYLDEVHRGEGPRTVITKVACLEGNLGGVRVTRSQISDQELRIKTELKTADALTNIGNRYREFGLQRNAQEKYEQALLICEGVSVEAGQLGGRLLEETYVQLWHIYYAMDRLELAAAMSQRLQREFPNSEFVDDALLQLADVSRKKGDLQRAIGIYSRLVVMEESQLRGEAQFGIAECYEQMAAQNTGAAQAQLLDRAFQEYKKVFDGYPDSGRVGEAVAKMADHYYKQKDFSRAVDTFESVLGDHPDAKFLDVILFNYGRCLYRMERKAEARRQFDQLISEYPESPLAADAKKIAEALAKAGF